MEGIDEHFVQSLRTADEGPAAIPTAPVDVEALRQLYRAQAIRAGHPYHRAGRPLVTRRPVR